MKKKLLIYNLLFISVLTVSAVAPAFEDTRYIKKAFSVGSNPNLEVSNKYGNIHIETWDTDSISFEVKINVTSNHLDKLSEMFHNVDVRFSNSSSYIAAETTWGNTGTLKGTKMDLKKMFGSNDRVAVTYTIKIPKNTDIELSNKFGDVYLPKQLQDVELDVSHGSIRGKNIGNAKMIRLKYGKLRLDKIEKGNLNLKFSDVNLEEAGKISIESSSSHIDIEEIQSLNLYSRHDRINIDKIESLNLNSSLTDLDIETLKREVNGTVKFGSLKIDQVATSFSSIDLKGGNTDILLDFTSGVGFNYTVWLENGKSFSVPAKLGSKEATQQNGDSFIYNGTFGKGSAAQNVKLNLKNSYVGFDLAD